MACECGTKIRIIGNATVGDSILNPFDAEWLYALCKYNDWKCVHTDNGVDFTIDTTIEVGNCSIPTYFIDMGHNFTFGGAHGFTLCPPAYISTSGSQTWTVTEKAQIRDALGVNGDKIDSTGGVLQDIELDTDALMDEVGGRWEIVANQMIFYKADNITEVMRFNLFDNSGNPSSTNVMKRERV